MLTRNIILAAIAVALAVFPLIMLRDAEWSGADDRGTEAISELNGDYEPWFESFFDPGEQGAILFGLQALIGTLVTTTVLGWLSARRRDRPSQVVNGGRERVVTGVLAILALIMVVALSQVQTEFGEILCFIRAMQGIGLGFFGYFLGQRLGRRKSTPVAATGRTG